MQIQSVSVGPVRIQTPIGLAPMAGVTDIVFRNICKEKGAGLLCTEMVSAKAILYRNKNTMDLLKTAYFERPVAVQLFGCDPACMAEASEMIKDLPFDILDLNMGCPVPKVVKNNEGSALMKDPELAGRIIEAVAKACEKPVTVKMRSGFDEGHINAPELAKIAESAGASAVTIHARTREQFYSGSADWDVIRRVKESISIPVFGNGDVKDGPSAVKMLKETGCDGIMVGRAAMGNPWIFREILHYFETGEESLPPSEEEIAGLLLYHAEEIIKEKGEYIGIRQMRSHAAWYLKGFRNAARLRRAVCGIESAADLENCLKSLLKSDNP